jgi:hypothetical protein
MTIIRPLFPTTPPPQDTTPRPKPQAAERTPQSVIEDMGMVALTRLEQMASVHIQDWYEDVFVTLVAVNVSAPAYIELVWSIGRPQEGAYMTAFNNDRDAAAHLAALTEEGEVLA